MALLLTAVLAGGAAFAAEAPLRLEVLRAEASGTVADILLRVEVPGGEAEELRAGDFAVFVAPADLPLAEATAPRFRVARLFLKRLGSAYYLDLRQLPAGVGATACQLVLQANRHGQIAVSQHLPRLLEPQAEELDVALVIDESLSMTSTDREKLRLEAAKTFVDLARRSPRISRIAIISFNERPRTHAGLTSPASADVLYRAIERIYASGMTDIDAALAQARSLFDASPGKGRAVVLLTDGRNEPGRYGDTHKVFEERRWPVYTIGLSDRADAEVLQRIAHDTGGEFHAAPTNAELQGIFARICSTLQKKVLIRTRDLALQPGQAAEDLCPVDDTIAALTFSLNAREPAAAFTLRDPKARLLTAALARPPRGVFYARKAGYQYFDVTSPQVGEWAARVESPMGRTSQATVAAAAVTPLLLRAFPLKPSYFRGEPIEFAASLAYGDSILADARIEARVVCSAGFSPSGAGEIRPEGRTTSYLVKLYDDGRHQDSGAADGVFAGFFPGSETPGPCTIHLLAGGTTPAGNRFEREVRISTTLLAEGYSKLWCSARALDFGVLYNGERASRAFELKLASALAGTAAETIQTAVLPPSSATSGPEAVRAATVRERKTTTTTTDDDEHDKSAATVRERQLPAEAVALDPSPLSLSPGRLTPVSLSISVPPHLSAGEYRGQLTLTSRYDKVLLPIQLEVRPPKLVFDRPALDLGALETGTRVEASLALRLDPRGSVAARLDFRGPQDFGGLSVEPKIVQVGPQPVAVRVVLAPPADPRKPAAVEAKLVVETPFGKAELPVTARIVHPSVSVAPATLDFGEVRPGEAAERVVTLRLEGLAPREATVAAEPLARRASGPPAPGGEAVPSLPLRASAEKLSLPPGGEAAAKLVLRVPPIQPPGAYQGRVVVRTPLGEQAVECTARVAEAETFRLPPSLDFGPVATGSTKELTVELASLVDAEQKVALVLPQPGADWQLAAEPASVVLPPLRRVSGSLATGKASIVFRLTAAAGAKPGPRQAAVAFRGPSRGATLDVRAELFRSPHESLAFEPAILDVGNLRSGVSEPRKVLVRSLIPEAQDVLVPMPRVGTPRAGRTVPDQEGEEGRGASKTVRPHAERGDEEGPAGVLAVTAEPASFPLPGAGSQALLLTFHPAQGVEEAEFEATLVARGRSLPATLRLRGRVFTPPNATFALDPEILDFGALTPGSRKSLTLRVQSLYPRLQRVLFAAPPAAEGVSLAAESAGLGLREFVRTDVPIELTVSSDAALGERRMAWEVRGPGRSATFGVRVEVVEAPAAPAQPVVARTELPGIGWAEGVALFLLLLLLIAILILTALLARRLLRAHRLPRMAKYLALSALLHAAVFLIVLDILAAREVQRQRVGPMFRVGLRAIGGGGLWSPQPSVADALRARQERERQVEAQRREGQAAKLARLKAEAERQQLAPAKSELSRPKSAEKPELAKAEPETKKLSVEDLAEVLETIREKDRVRQDRKADDPKAAQTDPARLAQLREMTREQIEAAVHKALQPKAAQPARPREPSVPPVVPDLSRPRPAEKVALKLDDLVPAIEGLKQELAQAGKPGAALTAQEVAAARAARQAGAERSGGAAEPAAQADASPSVAPGRPGARPAPAPAAPLQAPEGPAPGAKAAGPKLDTFEALMPAIEGPKAEPGQAASPTGTPAALDVGARRAARPAAAERGRGAGELVAPTEAPAPAAPGRAGVGRPAVPASLALAGAPAQERKAAPPSVGVAEDLRPAVEGPKAEQAVAAAPGGGLVAKEVGAGRAARAAAAERQGGAGERAAPAVAAALPAPARPGADRPADALAAQPVEKPGSERRPAPSAFAAPEEKPTADALVELPAGPRAAHGGGVPLPIAVSHLPPGAGGGPGRATAGAVAVATAFGPAGSAAARPTSPAPPSPPAAPASERQPAPAGFVAPEEAPTTDARAGLPAGPPAAQGGAGPAAVPLTHQPAGAAAAVGREGGAVPSGPAPVLADVPAAIRPATPGAPQPVEFPATERQAAPPSFSAPDEQPTAEAPVALPAGPAPGQGGMDAAAVAAPRRPSPGAAAARVGGPAAPAAAAPPAPGHPETPLGRPESGVGLPAAAAAPTGDKTAPASEKLELVEGPLVAPRHAEGGGESASAPGPQTVVARWRLRPRAEAERALALASLGSAGELQPRPSPAAGRPAEGPVLPPLGPLDRAEPAKGGPRPADTREEAPQETVEVAPRVGMPGAAKGPAEGQTELAAPAAAAAPKEREAHTVVKRPLAAREASLGHTPGLSSAQLLLPGVQRQPRGQGALVGTEDGQVTEFVLTTARYSGGEADWDTHRTAMPFLAWQLRENIGFNVGTRVVEVPLDSANLVRAPWVFMTGHRDFRLTPAQVENLRRYLVAGGTLWADDCTHEDDLTWDTAFRREIVRVLPPEQGFRIRRISRTDNHPLFRACFDLANGYRGYFPPPGDKFRQSFIEIIELNGRAIVIYTRNDYACGLEIRPDTAPSRVSLSGLSPEEMQEASFMMTCNILVYALTRGRGLADPGLVGRAAGSILRRQDERRAQDDEYAKAPATLFDAFAGDQWRAEEKWDHATPAELSYARPADPKAPGRRLAVQFRLQPQTLKTVFSRDLPEEIDLSDQDRCYVDLECRVEAGARLSLAFSTMPDWKYFESRPVFLKPGRNRVYFDLRGSTWKTGEPVPEGQSEFCRRVANLDAVRRLSLLLYPLQGEGTVVLDRIEFRARPQKKGG